MEFWKGNKLGDDISKVEIMKGKCRRNKDSLSLITPNSHYAGEDEEE
jgi:hypothetical protein